MGEVRERFTSSLKPIGLEFKGAVAYLLSKHFFGGDLGPIFDSDRKFAPCRQFRIMSTRTKLAASHESKDKAKVLATYSDNPNKLQNATQSY
jgi:hypothetical protein